MKLKDERMDRDPKYKEICEKLGFIPSELSNDDVSHTEDDSKPNPFSILTLEESLYLYRNGYLRKANEI